MFRWARDSDDREVRVRSKSKYFVL
jgi:hypothetical protein